MVTLWGLAEIPMDISLRWMYIWCYLREIPRLTYGIFLFNVLDTAALFSKVFSSGLCHSYNVPPVSLQVKEWVLYLCFRSIMCGHLIYQFVFSRHDWWWFIFSNWKFSYPIPGVCYCWSGSRPIRHICLHCLTTFLSLDWYAWWRPFHVQGRPQPVHFNRWVALVTNKKALDSHGYFHHGKLLPRNIV